ncbi:hypothetical protein LPB140_03690 [Sphingorhabdus lutea]|uniref:Type IV secretion system protein n=1 Tax=Sphingorhabdus lutea TaxID=1913578 RepID=A0A1L3JAB2_9SPHN|nr:type IV secretion system protein [Sphingorhabdus lutea]APG62064.1 hypothetical protein LPB140_03690 [Sphingorhabdus lutea]
MNINCQNAVNNLGNGVAAALQHVDCVAEQMAGDSFARLFAPGGMLGPALSILLALFIAIFAYGLILGRTNLNIRSLIPNMIIFGLVLTFATSFIAYQTVIWNLAVSTPDYLATTLSGDKGSATINFAQKIDIIFGAIEQISQGQIGPNGQKPNISAFSPEGLMWMGAMLLLLGTVGILVTARIGLGLLVAFGPIFVVMALFNGTRGLFAGWVKGVVMLGLTSMLAVLGGSLMLEMAAPILNIINLTPSVIELRPAMAFFMIGAVHVALMIMILKVSANMVSGWQIFGSAKIISANISAQAPVPHAPAYPVAVFTNGGFNNPIMSPSRHIPLSAITPVIAANDQGNGPPATLNGQAQIVRIIGHQERADLVSANKSRTSGIGNKFKSARKKINDKSGSILSKEKQP